MSQAVLLKRDIFGHVEVAPRDDGPAIRRVACGSTVPMTHRIAEFLAQREQRILRSVGAIAGIPQPLGRDEDGNYWRTYLEGEPLYRFGSLGPEYWEALLALVQGLHTRGVTHNDLHKEANILVTPHRLPALVDFQVAAHFRLPPHAIVRGWFAMLCREDIRHVLKQKKLHDPDLVTAVEQRSIDRKALPVRLWSATLMRPYQRLVVRLGWEPAHGPEGR